MNPLLELKRLGQSVWLEDLRKGLVTSGELRRFLDEYAVTGVTFNPAIFERALSGAQEYDDDVSGLASEGLSAAEAFARLAARDARLAADALSGAYRDSKGRDGLVSVEVDPALSADAGAIVREAAAVYSEIDRPNVVVKVPATAEGLKAAEELAFRGMGVNFTLVFSAGACEAAAWAYIRGLEARAKGGLPVKGIPGMACILVNRIDTLFDRLMEERIEASRSNDEKARLKGLLGRVAVASCRAAVSAFEAVFASERFGRLEDAGAVPLKLLFTATGVKNPAYHDVKYVEELAIGGTINAMPLHALLAFYDHGRLRAEEQDQEELSRRVFTELDSLGIDFNGAASRLASEGLNAAAASFRAILKAVEEKMETMKSGRVHAMRFALNGYEPAVAEAMAELTQENFLERLWAKDPTLWKSGPDHKRIIKDSLGWITLPELMDEHIEEAAALAREIKGEGYADIVLLGMGGSSLAPLVFATAFGPQDGYPRLHVLDSTDPEALKNTEGRIDLARTLFIVSSKSGSTIEPLSLFEYFHDRLKALKGEDGAGRDFVAITDPGTPLEGFSRKHRFRKLFRNPKDVGGRFSALSYFGLVPAALMGLDAGRLLEHASRVEASVHPCTESAKNPVLMLGAALGALGRAGRDKVTFVMPERVSTFGMWIEQLIAESTGKEGKGLVPVVNEPLGRPEDYGPDRVFVSIGIGQMEQGLDRALKALATAGHPVIDLRLADVYELGGEFLRWEIATSVAGQILGINPFDQPDVELAKKLTIARLGSLGNGGALTPAGVKVEENGFGLWFGASAADKMDVEGAGAEVALKEFVGLINEGDYIGIMAYYDPADERLNEGFTELRLRLRDATRAATQFGYGPRYLHSTGQLHKGGPNKGLFFIICHGAGTDFRVPGAEFSFSELELSQAMGDMEALDSKGCRVALVKIKDPSAEGLEAFEGALKRGLRQIGRD